MSLSGKKKITSSFLQFFIETFLKREFKKSWTFGDKASLLSLRHVNSSFPLVSGPWFLGNGLNLNNVARLILLTSSLDPWIFTLGKNKGSQPYLKSLSKRIENVSNCSFFRPFVQILTHSKRPECEVMNIFSTSLFRPCRFYVM